MSSSFVGAAQNSEDSDAGNKTSRLAAERQYVDTRDRINHDENVEADAVKGARSSSILFLIRRCLSTD